MATTETAAPYVGQSVPRVEDGRLPPRPRHVRRRHPAARDAARGLRTQPVRARDASPVSTRRAHGRSTGVALVLTAEDIGDLAPIATGLPRDEVVPNSRPVLPAEKVRFVGEAVACVVASSRYVAEDAVQLIDVDYEPLEPVVDAERSLAEGAPLLHDGTESNNFAHIEYEQGDVEAAFAAADHVFRKRFHHGRFHAVPLEGRGLVADWDAGTQDMTIWMSTQIPHLVRTLLCHAIGLSEKQLRVIAPDVGGGFGLKLHLWPEDYLVSSASKRVNRPVKWVEDRYEALAASLHAKEIICELELATKADGTFLAMRGRYVGDAGAYAAYPFTPLVDSLCAAVMLPNLYAVRSRPLRGRRGVHEQVPVGGLPRCRLDERPDGPRAARRRGRPRARDRSRWSCGSRTRSRTDSRTSRRPGCKYDGGSYAEAQRKAMELIGYDEIRRRQDEAPSRGPLPRHRPQPLPRAGRLVGRARQAHGLPVRLPRLGSRHDRAGRLRRRHARPALPRPGAQDDDGAGRRRQALGADRERQDRPGGHGFGRVRSGYVR